MSTSPDTSLRLAVKIGNIEQKLVALVAFCVKRARLCDNEEDEEEEEDEEDDNDDDDDQDQDEKELEPVP
ncbi:hypothetical protein M0802_013438 [Mischocyttarus mexicanus]|nr:hypothetical protein M0802_013438 [Mischocyttarus mexicanus]